MQALPVETSKGNLTDAAAIVRNQLLGGMKHKLSMPNILGLQMLAPMLPGYQDFMTPLPNLSYASQPRLKSAQQGIQSSLVVCNSCSLSP